MCRGVCVCRCLCVGVCVCRCVCVCVCVRGRESGAQLGGGFEGKIALQIQLVVIGLRWLIAFKVLTVVY